MYFPFDDTIGTLETHIPFWASFVEPFYEIETKSGNRYLDLASIHFIAMAEYRAVANDICVCKICNDTKATVCQLQYHHTCCAKEDSVYLQAYQSDEMLD